MLAAGHAAAAASRVLLREPLVLFQRAVSLATALLGFVFAVQGSSPASSRRFAPQA